MADRVIEAPQSTPETEAFWQAAAQGRFLLKTCNDCGKPHWFPRAICPFCFSDNTVWREASGRGTIYSFSIPRKVAAPYVIAYVTLAEGPTMMTNIVDCDAESLAIGQNVALVFKPSDGGPPVPCFRPV